MDLTKRPEVSVQVEKVGSDPYCEMSINSKVEKKINVAVGTKASLSFLDCPKEDVRLTASKIIGKIILFCMLMQVFKESFDILGNYLYYQETSASR